jgi:hypothetical protein
MSIKTRAAGFSITTDFKIVAPSFVICIPPYTDYNILSIPHGPNVVFTMSLIAVAPIKLDNRASSPFSYEDPSFINGTVV